MPSPGLLDDATVLPVGAGLFEVLGLGPALQGAVVILRGRGFGAGNLGQATLHAVEPGGGAAGVVGGDLDAKQDRRHHGAAVADMVQTGVDSANHGAGGPEVGPGMEPLGTKSSSGSSPA